MNFDINKINMRDTIDYNLYENYEDYTLNELKSLLYIKTKNNKIDEVDKIKNIINNKIIQQKKNMNYNNKIDEIDEDLIKLKSITKKSSKIIKTLNESEKSEESDNNSTKSDDLLVRNDDINKLYDRVDKKGQNQRFTQTSQKLFDRMFSEASYINKIGVDNVVIKPFINNDDKKSTKLGIRKNIIRN
jgi:hypothetical protein